MISPRDSNLRPAVPMRSVVYIVEREGAQGGGFWWLILECGHSVARKRYAAKSPAARFRPLRDALAPQRALCHSCRAGQLPQDPALLIRALGGEVP